MQVLVEMPHGFPLALMQSTVQPVAEVHTLNKLFCGATACLRASKDLPYFPDESISALFKGERTLTHKVI